MINDDIMTITLSNSIPSEFSPVSKYTLMNRNLPCGVEILAIPIDPNYNRPAIKGTLVSIYNEFNLFSRLTMKIRFDSGHYKIFSPIKYDISFRYKKTKEDLKREAIINLLNSL